MKKAKFAYTYRVMKNNEYRHPEIEIRGFDYQGKFYQYGGECLRFEAQADPKTSMPYGLHAEIKIQFGNFELAMAVMDALKRASPYGPTVRGLVDYVRKNGERYVYARVIDDYIPARFRHHPELWKQADKAGITLKKAA